MSDQECFDELAGLERILAILRRYRQVLLEQAAQQGINAPPSIRLEIEHYTEQIRNQEAEIARVKTEAAQDKFSLVEAEYRVLLAEAWDTPQARPSAPGTMRLEFERLRLGMPIGQAEELEHEVRVALAEDAFYTSNFNIAFAANGAGSWARLLEMLLPTIGRAVRFDPLTALRLTLAIIPPNEDKILSIGNIMYSIHTKVWNKEEKLIFERFLKDLRFAILERQKVEKT